MKLKGHSNCILVFYSAAGIIIIYHTNTGGIIDITCFHLSPHMFGFKGFR